MERVEPHVEALFASYRDAFERGDAEAIAGHFGDSVHVTSDTGSAVRVDVAAGGAWRATIERLVAQYRALGVARAELGTLEVTRVSPRLAVAGVRWALLDGGGRPVYDFHAVYTLACEGPSCRIVAIAHDEIARARRGAGAPRPAPEPGS